MSAASRHSPHPSPRASRARGRIGAGSALVVLLWCAQVGAETLPADGDPSRALLKGLGIALLVALLGTAALIAALIQRESRTTGGKDASHGISTRPTKPARVGLFGFARRPSQRQADVASMAAGAAAGAADRASGAALIKADISDTQPIDTKRVLGSDHLDTTVAARHCADCDRIFDISARFCAYDGSELRLVEDLQSTLQTDAEMLCPECGQGHEPGTVWCPDDNARLIPRDPAAHAHATIGVVFCSTCQHEYLPNHHTCPKDGQPLLPMLGRRTCGQPGTGIGPKRRICPECGIRHAVDTDFCNQDGHALVNMN